MGCLLWIVLGELFIGAMPILVVAAIFLILWIVEWAEGKREERRQRKKMEEQ